MKKLIIAVAAVAMAFATQAAMTDWKLSSVKSDYNGWYCYVIAGDTAPASFASFTDVENASVSNGKVSGSTSKSAKGSASDASFTKAGGADYYFVLVNGNTAEATSYMIAGAPVHSDLVYDPTAQESSPGTTTTTFANASFGTVKTFGGGDVPEPTSAMLLLLGVAGLALRRRQA